MKYELAINMKPELKKAWIDALRSGDYKQASGELQDVDPSSGETTGYCCLGVLLDICGEGEWVPSTTDDEYYAPEYVMDFKVDGANDHAEMKETLHNSVLDYFGIDLDTASHLMGANDGGSDYGDNNFDQIADAIETGVLITNQCDCDNCNCNCDKNDADD
jgi:hypothetical protein